MYKNKCVSEPLTYHYTHSTHPPHTHRLPHEVTSFKSTVTREKLLYPLTSCSISACIGFIYYTLTSHVTRSLLLCQPFNDALLQQPLSQMAHTDVKVSEHNGWPEQLQLLPLIEDLVWLSLPYRHSSNSLLIMWAWPKY